MYLDARALRDWGFVGIKIYPPIGFYPQGNGVLPRNSKAPEPVNRQLLDGPLQQLFKMCAKYDAPVMAHSEQTMGYDDWGDDFAMPDAWEILLKEYGTVLTVPPRINLGHFGGDGPAVDVATNKVSTWPADYAKLMSKYPEAASNVYGDLAYWSSLRDCQSGDVPISATGCTALPRLAAAVAANPDVVNRIMYGSDWFMMIKEPDWADYPGIVARATAKVLPNQDAFFFKNAISAFNLHGVNQQQRLARALGSLPSWLLQAT